MTDDRIVAEPWYRRNAGIRVWHLLATAVLAPILVLWFLVVHQEDEILALVRNEVITDSGGACHWTGSFVNTHDETLRDVAVAVDLLDGANRPVGRAEGRAADLPFGAHLDLQAPLPTDATRIRIETVQWRLGRSGIFIGPFREPWEFGYVMAGAGSAPAP